MKLILILCGAMLCLHAAHADTMSSVVSTGGVTSAGPIVDGSKVRVTTLTGADTIPANTTWWSSQMATTQLAETLTLTPPTGAAGFLLRISTVGQITALNFSPTLIGWVNGNTLPAGYGLQIGWDAPSATWQRVQ